MRKKIALVISLIVGLSVFLGWMSLVGNPHVIETSMGLIISIIVAVWISHKINPWKMPK